LWKPRRILGEGEYFREFSCYPTLCKKFLDKDFVAKQGRGLYILISNDRDFWMNPKHSRNELLSCLNCSLSSKLEKITTRTFKSCLSKICYPHSLFTSSCCFSIFWISNLFNFSLKISQCLFFTTLCSLMKRADGIFYDSK